MTYLSRADHFANYEEATKAPASAELGEPYVDVYKRQEYIRKYQTERGRSIKVTVFGDGEDITENYSGGFDTVSYTHLNLFPVITVIAEHQSVDGKAAIHLKIKNRFCLFKGQEAV